MATDAVSPRKKATRRRPPADEPLPVVGGRYLIALGMLLVVVVVCSPGSPVGTSIASAFGPKPEFTDQSAWKAGNTSEIKVTLITADRNRLACAHGQTFQDVHCEWKAEAERWPPDANRPLDDDKAAIIQPYRTAPDNKLVYLSGLWAHPQTAMRYHREPPIGVPVKQLARFVATCQVEWLGPMEGAKSRWAAGSRWQNDGQVMVGKTKVCTVKSM